MKNKFKKSKIIVPALALITATTVASVTGTVAWFTASRTVTVTQGNFKSETEGNSLKVVATGKSECGTTTNGISSAVTINGNLTHGSYNAMKTTAISGDAYQNHLFSPNINDDGVYSYNDLGTIDSHNKDEKTTGTDYSTNKWIASTSGNTNTWYAVAWTLKFTQTNSSSTSKNHLLLDPASTLFEDKATAPGETLDGFRIALMTADHCIVIGGDEITSHVTDVNRYTWKQISTDNNNQTYNASTNYYDFTTHEKLSHVTSDSFNTDKANLYTYSDSKYKLVEDDSGFSADTIYYKKVGSGYVMQMTSKVLSDENAKTKVVTAEEIGGSLKVTGEGNWSTISQDSTTSTIFVTQKTPHTKPTDGSNNVTSDLYYLGEINGNDETGLAVTCVAWFEGTDTTAITTYTDQQKTTERKMSEVQATLNFYSRSTETTGA